MTARVAIVGTSHIAKKSITDVTAMFESLQPDIVCVELDKGRFEALMSKEKTKFSFGLIRKIGIKGTLFLLIGGSIQRSLAKKAGTKPGSDMLAGIELAKKHDKKVALIDQPAQITMQKFSRHFKKREVFGALWDVVLGFFGKKAPPIQYFDVFDVPTDEQLKPLLMYMQSKFPSAYTVLLEQRNIYMVNKLKMVVAQNPDAKILVVVGAAHKPGMIALLQHENNNKKSN